MWVDSGVVGCGGIHITFVYLKSPPPIITTTQNDRDISLENALLHRHDPHNPTSPPVLRLIDLEMARLIPTPTALRGSRRGHQWGAAPAFPCSLDSEREEEDLGWEEEESKSDDGGGSTWGWEEEEHQPPSPRLRCVVGGKPNYCAPEVGFGCVHVYIDR